MDLVDAISDFIDDPFKLLMGFFMLLVPSSIVIWLLIGGGLLKGTDYDFIVSIIIFIVDVFNNFTTWLVETFIGVVVDIVIIAFIIGTILSIFGIKINGR